jgi:hypothetical protein
MEPVLKEFGEVCRSVHVGEMNANVVYYKQMEVQDFSQWSKTQ